MTAAGEQTRNRAQARVGTIIRDKWRLESLLGVGGTAAVYAATHRNGRRGAVKILRNELTGIEEVTTRFAREGYLANQINHPAVVSVLDDDVTEDGAPFLVMELLDGYALDRHTRGAHTALDLETAIRVADTVLDVLASAHALGIIHRDIKPANVFLSRSGEVRVLDFGIARITSSLDAGMTQTGTAIGTPGYMAPEQARGRWAEVDARTDLWAVGASLYALLLGERPRRAETVQEELLAAMTQPLAPSAPRLPGVPAALCAFIDKSVSYEREARFVDAREMQAALRALDLHGARGHEPQPTMPLAQVPELRASRPSLPQLDDAQQPHTGPSWPSATAAQMSTSQPVLPPAPVPQRRALWLGGLAACIGLGALGVALTLWTSRGAESQLTIPPAAVQPALAPPAEATEPEPAPSGADETPQPATPPPEVIELEPVPEPAPAPAPAAKPVPAVKPAAKPAPKPAAAAGGKKPAPARAAGKAACDPYAHPEGCN